MMGFSEALKALKNGKRVERSGWNGKGMWIALVVTWRSSDMNIPREGFDVAPFIGMKTVDNKFVPWLASQTDILADDWSEVA